MNAEIRTFSLRFRRTSLFHSGRDSVAVVSSRRMSMSKFLNRKMTVAEKPPQKINDRYIRYTRSPKSMCLGNKLEAC